MSGKMGSFEPFYSICQTVGGFIGIDVGSVSTNVIFLDDSENVIETVYTYTRGRVLDAIKTSFSEIQERLPNNTEILGVGVTGSSGELAKLILNADLYRTEIYSHAAATIHQIPDVKTIMEIGGRDSKVIYVNNGIPEKSKMNVLLVFGFLTINFCAGDRHPHPR